MLSDFRLMFNNAREYNMVGSQIYMDSIVLESVVTATLNTISDNVVLVLPPTGRYEGISARRRYFYISILLGPRSENMLMKAGEQEFTPSPKPMKVRTPKVLRPHENNSPLYDISSSPRADFRSLSRVRAAEKVWTREQQQMLSIYDALVSHQNADGRTLSIQFMKLPSKAVSFGRNWMNLQRVSGHRPCHFSGGVFQKMFFRSYVASLGPLYRRNFFGGHVLPMVLEFSKSLR